MTGPTGPPYDYNYRQMSQDLSLVLSIRIGEKTDD